MEELIQTCRWFHEEKNPNAWRIKSLAGKQYPKSLLESLVNVEHFYRPFVDARLKNVEVLQSQNAQIICQI
jgi:hypothetical protein